VRESVTLHNSSRTAAHTYELVVPSPLLSRLTVSPTVAQLKPGETVRIEVVFSPQQSDLPAVEVASTEPAAVTADTAPPADM
jgi:protein involved in polysaccharide export with SLBB domain